VLHLFALIKHYFSIKKGSVIAKCSFTYAVAIATISPHKQTRVMMMTKIKYHGISLGKLAELENAHVPEHMKNKLALRVVEAKGMFFSGDVLFHIAVQVNDGGLNRTGEWPHYLVVDDGVRKIISA
jgi:hypothetical protein